MIAINRTNSDNPSDRPSLQPGQLIRHRRYGYRGVIVDFDESCQADEKWYQKNQTQPNRDQRWYHVLVDGTSTCTYVASENLAVDSSQFPIDHPLLQHFFSGFEDGRYLRNDISWPK